jgi:hypothetical protein
MDNATFRLSDSPKSKEILQFARNRGGQGEFGHFNPQEDRIDWTITDGSQFKASFVKAINASKVLISGSILTHGGLPDCAHQLWKVVTESTDSSNILVYGPSDLSFYCESSEDDQGYTVVIVLPVHAIWANVVGYPADTSDPSWKAAGVAPTGYDCDGASPLKAPSQ